MRCWEIVGKLHQKKRVLWVLKKGVLLGQRYEDRLFWLRVRW